MLENKNTKLKSRFSIETRAKIVDEYVLFVDDLYVSFKDKSIKNKDIFNKYRDVLKGVTFGLRQGETLAILGANGAGKTVLMETIMGFNKPQRGIVYLNLGEKTFLENIKKVGMQFQQSKFPKKLKVKKLINLYTKIYGKLVIKETLDKMIIVCGVDEFLDRKILDLSGGQRQRLNLLLSLIHQPKIMILDEFITGLDVKTVRKIITYVNELKVNNQASMIIISHQPEEIQELADRILILKDGKLIGETTVKKVLKEYGDMALFVEENI